MSANAPSGLRCRKIIAADTPSIARLLARGFPGRSLSYWTAALRELADRDCPENYPRYGYLLEYGREPVGVLLTIFHKLDDGAVRCNISSWHVADAFRGYASLLVTCALRHRDVVYMNISPAPSTWGAIEAQGFRRYCNGQFVTLPALGRNRADAHVVPYDGAVHDRLLSTDEREAMPHHTGRGCIGRIVLEENAAYPYLFLPRRVLSIFPALQLVYSRDLSCFQHHAQALGRALLARGHLTVLVDANGPLPNIPGLYLEDRGPKYFKGPRAPRLGDLTFCENVLFGP
jgi:hypothetical protein